MFTMLLHRMFGTRGPSQLHHPNLLIWCSSYTGSSRFPRSTNRSHAPALSGTQGHQSPGSKNWKTPVHVSPSLPLSFVCLGEYGWKAAPHLTMLCYGQHSQSPSLASVDLEKLQYSVNQSSTHKCTFVFQTSQWTMPFPQLPSPSS